MRKDGASIAETLINTTKDVVQTLTSFSSGSWTELRLIHLLVADSINTNANAAKRVWNFFNAQEGMGPHPNQVWFAVFPLCFSHC